MNIIQPEPGHDDGPTYSNRETAYEALSYTWGDPNPVFEVEIDGKRLPVTHNLFFALQHLRYEASKRYMGNETICCKT
jgi:hypothetical protein